MRQTENYKNNLDISFPDKTILEIRFLNTEYFYSISFKNNNYIIVGRDKDIKTNLIGIAKDKKVYHISADDGTLCYITVNIRTFIKELLLFDDYMNTNNLPENPDDVQLSEFTDRFKLKKYSN